VSLIRSRCARGLAAIVVAAAGMSTGACTRPADTDPQLDVTWSLRPEAPVVGPATLTVTVGTPSGSPVTGAVVRLEGHMSHPGMAPILADASERAPGVYEIPFAFTMAGDWALLVSATRADGARVERRIDVAGVRSSQ
jgi:hypothetical protein